MFFKISFPGIIILGTSLLAPQNAMAEAAITEVNATRQNELVYFLKHDCGSCHGMTLKGGLGPALLPETLSAQPKEYLVTT
ncbi:MAG: cytochrome c, partial [Gammaproteobacteria bacterium]|nr:cytochrome c [Gammaproteobacteria bacterium]